MLASVGDAGAWILLSQEQIARIVPSKVVALYHVRLAGYIPSFIKFILILLTGVIKDKDTQ